MPDSSDKSRSDTQLPDSIQPRPFAVGYGKPPVANRFKPGQSGNRRGRPRAPSSHHKDEGPSLANLVNRASSRTIEVRRGDTITKMPIKQALVEQLFQAAAKGDKRLFKEIFALIKTAEHDSDSLRRERIAIAIAYKNCWREVFHHRDRLRQPRATPEIHPDDVIVSDATGDVTILRNSRTCSSGKKPETAVPEPITQVDLDWLRRTTPTEAEIRELAGKEPPSATLNVESMPINLRNELKSVLLRYKQWEDGELVLLASPAGTKRTQYVLRTGEKIDLARDRPIAVTAEEAEPLIHQGWLLVDPKN